MTETEKKLDAILAEIREIHTFLKNLNGLSRLVSAAKFGTGEDIEKSLGEVVPGFNETSSQP